LVLSIQKLIRKDGNLNVNLTRQVSEAEALAYRNEASVFTASINTAYYCIKHEIECKKCRTCGNELSVENFY